MKSINMQKVIAGFVLGATALMGSGVSAFAQGNQQRKREKAQQRQVQVQPKRDARQPKQTQAAPRQVQIPQRQTEVRQRQRVQIDQQQQPEIKQRRQVQVDQQQRQQVQVDRQRQRQAQIERQNQVQVTPRRSADLDRQRQIELQQRQGVVDRSQPPMRRLTEQQQRQRIDLQRQRIVNYDRRLNDQRRIAEQRARILQQQRRIAQYRYQQEYLRRLYEQQRALAAYRNYNYYNDPFFYTAPSWRYARSGHYYYVNNYAADLLRQAVNYGYQEGYNAGLADRQDRWGFGYRDSFAYQDANFGFNGLYVDASEYNYYFREGFRRGYEDAYYGRSQYGSFVSGKGALIGAAVLAGILGLVAIADNN